jgi:hypothetical protein
MPVSKRSAICELSHALTPSINSSLLIPPVLQVGKQVEGDRSEIRAVRRVVKQLALEMLQQCSSESNCMGTSIVMEEHYTGCQHSIPFV